MGCQSWYGRERRASSRAVQEEAPYLAEDGISVGGRRSAVGDPYKVGNLAVATREPGRHLTVGMFRGAYADTLRALFGGPGGGVVVDVLEDDRARGRVVAVYDAREDQIRLDTSVVLHQPQSYSKHIVAHEWWHMAASRVGVLTASAWENVGEASENTYAGSSRAEQQAEAFAFAFTWVQSTWRLGKDLPLDDAMGALMLFERSAPGARLMAGWLLSNPIYKEHPLAREVKGLPRVQTPPWRWDKFHDGGVVPFSVRLVNSVAVEGMLSEADSLVGTVDEGKAMSTSEANKVTERLRGLGRECEGNSNLRVSRELEGLGGR